MEKELPSDIIGFILYPMHKRTKACKPSQAECWGIHAEKRSGDNELYAGTRDIDELPEVMTNLVKAYPGSEERLVVRWLDEDGKTASVGPASINDVIDGLMEVVCDETPDDAENTDDHPLEEMRSILDDLQMRLAQGSAPAPGA